jgi:hypothetical protein
MLQLGSTNCGTTLWESSWSPLPLILTIIGQRPDAFWEEVIMRTKWRGKRVYVDPAPSVIVSNFRRHNS